MVRRALASISPVVPAPPGACPYALPAYHGYDQSVDGSILNLFSTAAYRYGHSALSPTLLRLDAAGQPIPEGPLALRDAFFSPARITQSTPSRTRSTNRSPWPICNAICG